MGSEMCIRDRNNNGINAIMCAVSKNSSESLKLLLEHSDVDVNARGNKGETAIMYAAVHNRIDALKLQSLAELYRKG